MEKKPSNLIFIDRNNYNNLLDKKFDLSDLINSINGEKENTRLSSLTTAIIFEINDKINKAFFDQYFYAPVKFSLFNKLNNTDLKYVDSYVKDSLCKSEEVCIYSDASKKYYELIPLMNNDILVVFEESFFSIITESKDKLKEFVLDCLCYQYKFNSSLEYLMKLYLNLKINENSLDMIKLRFN